MPAHPTQEEDPIRFQTPIPMHNPAASLGDNVQEGPVTASYLIDAERVVALLNQALASEMVSFLTYTAQATALHGLRADPLTKEFREHAAQEMEHAQLLITRIDQLGGTPELNPSEFVKHAIHPYETPETLEAMVAYQLNAERRAVEFYREAIQWISDRDPTTRRLLEDILAVEEHHANDLEGLIHHTR